MQMMPEQCVSAMPKKGGRGAKGGRTRNTRPKKSAATNRTQQDFFDRISKPTPSNNSNVSTASTHNATHARHNTNHHAPLEVRTSSLASSISSVDASGSSVASPTTRLSESTTPPPALSWGCLDVMDHPSAGGWVWREHAALPPPLVAHDDVFPELETLLKRTASEELVEGGADDELSVNDADMLRDLLGNCLALVDEEDL